MILSGLVSAETTGPDPIASPELVPSTSLVYLEACQTVLIGAFGGGPISVQLYTVDESGEIVTPSVSSVFRLLGEEMSVPSRDLVPVASPPIGPVYVRVTSGSGVGRAIVVYVRKY